MSDPIQPQHYRSHPSGVECIEITRLQSFTLGNCLKYLWRAGQKDDLRQDLLKALQYVDWAIEDDAEYVEAEAIDRFLAWYDSSPAHSHNDWVLRNFFREDDLKGLRYMIVSWLRHA